MTQPSKRLYSEISPLGAGIPFRPGDWRKLSQIVHDDHNIKGFFGDYRWLSNFGAAVIILDGVAYKSVEHAYQAAKWSPSKRSFFLDCQVNESITYNRDNSPDLYTPSEWDLAKLGIMRALLADKFNPELNPDVAAKLVETGERYLEETNWWDDTFWGKDLTGNGENHLGSLLMEARTELTAR